MKQTVNFSTFQMAFEAIRPENFSYEGLSVLFDYLEQLEQDIGEELELDVIALCCDYSQCSLSEFEQAFSESLEIYFDTPEEDKKQIIEDYIQKNGFFYAFVEDGKEIVFENF